MFDTKSGLEIIAKDESMALLRTEVIGRIGVVSGGSPEIFPVNYAVCEDGILFRTAAGTKLTGVMNGPVVFEVDRIDAATRSGWSVVVHGRAEEVDGFTRPDLREAFEALPVDPWADGPKEHLVRVVPSRVAGRRIGSA
jgi:nitroimidazol reductase NimA-like FMN-containing flavoprotein (pyridoxamine 5'-phosphate oxidase superfamily)